MTLRRPMPKSQSVRRDSLRAPWLPGRPGSSVPSGTSTGRSARGAMPAARLLSDARVWLGMGPLARGRDLPRWLNFGSDLVCFSGPPDQSAVFAGIGPV